MRDSSSNAKTRFILEIFIYSIKLPIKIIHQLGSLILHRNLVKFHLKYTHEAWPKDSLFRNTAFRGTLFCEVSVDIKKILITNIWAKPNRGGLFYTWPNFVNFFDSLSLLEARNPSNDPDKKMFHAKLSELAKIKKHRVHVLQRLNGEIMVIDGTNRLISVYLRDGNLKNLDFFITFQIPNYGR